LHGRFPEEAGSTVGVTCVFYDAYSKKMDADLWQETSLVTRLDPLLARNCVLSTYAATGTMKRALKTLGFRLLPRTGFLGKRESTLAIREKIR
jgi:tRNA U34 5-methylaminomethyl-2-thiouridine-forming methyltransferase MnmC